MRCRRYAIVASHATDPALGVRLHVCFVQEDRASSRKARCAVDTALRWRVRGQYDGLWDGQVGAMEDDAANIHGDDGVLAFSIPRLP